MAGKVRIGVAGGGFGTAFFWHEHPDCVVQAVADLRAEPREALAKRYRCATTYTSLDEMLKDRNVDAVALFTGAPNHARHAVQALKAGKHVLVDAPACWTLDEARMLVDAVRQSGLIYMSAETSYWADFVISARKFYQDGKFGEVFACDAMYVPPASALSDDPYHWRYGLPPMRWAAHALSLLVSVTGERLTEVVCHGCVDKSEQYEENRYGNPFSRQTAMFKTSAAHAFCARVWMTGAEAGIRADWYGTKMSFIRAGTEIIRTAGQTEKDSAGFVRKLQREEKYKQVEWWTSDMLPEPLRHPTDYRNSLGFITHEFVDAVARGRRAAPDLYDALAYAVPGIIAHESAMKHGQMMKIPALDRV